MYPMSSFCEFWCNTAVHYLHIRFSSDEINQFVMRHLLGIWSYHDKDSPVGPTVHITSYINGGTRHSITLVPSTVLKKYETIVSFYEIVKSENMLRWGQCGSVGQSSAQFAGHTLLSCMLYHGQCVNTNINKYALPRRFIKDGLLVVYMKHSKFYMVLSDAGSSMSSTGILINVINFIWYAFKEYGVYHTWGR